jgi:23S rRNA (guanosine2251-2'-O)-methyltransferase
MLTKTLNEELGRPSVEEFKQQLKFPVTVILDNVRSLNNVGSVFRTCDAFSIEHLYLCGITGTPPNKEIHKTALGSTDSVNWSYCGTVEQAIEIERAKQSIVVAIEQSKQAVLLNEFAASKEKRYCFIFGNEVEGVSESAINLCDLAIEIPQWGTKHSINVAVSAGVVLWEAVKQLRG